MTKDQLSALILDSEDAMYRTALGILRNEDDVGDTIQNTIVKAFENYPALREDRYARTWLMKILINECRDLLRSRKREYLYEEPPEEAFEVEDRDFTDLYKAMMTLPQAMRVVISLYYAEEFSIREIALLLEISEGTVKSRLSRARAALRDRMTGSGK